MTFDDKLKLAYVNTAKFVAAMDPLADPVNYPKYVRIALQLSQGGQSVDWFVRNDMLLGAGYTADTPQATIEARLSALLLILLKLGFGA